MSTTFKTPGVSSSMNACAVLIWILGAILFMMAPSTWLSLSGACTCFFFGALLWAVGQLGFYLAQSAYYAQLTYEATAGRRSEATHDTPRASPQPMTLPRATPDSNGDRRDARGRIIVD